MLAARLLCALLAAPLAQVTQAAVPGTFFWKPRVGLDITMPTQVPIKPKHLPTWENIHKGYVVLVEGYRVGMAAAALAGWLQDARAAHPQLHPGRAHYYTNAYRWAARHLSLIPEWLGARNQHYISTHRVWRKRFYYMDYFVPPWMRKLLFFVDDKSWKYEEWEWRRFAKYAEPHFGKYHRYPSKWFDNFNSMRPRVTAENIDITGNSFD